MFPIRKFAAWAKVECISPDSRFSLMQGNPSIARGSSLAGSHGGRMHRAESAETLMGGSDHEGSVSDDAGGDDSVDTAEQMHMCFACEAYDMMRNLPDCHGGRLFHGPCWLAVRAYIRTIPPTRARR